MRESIGPGTDACRPRRVTNVNPFRQRTARASNRAQAGACFLRDWGRPRDADGADEGRITRPFPCSPLDAVAYRSRERSQQCRQARLFGGREPQRPEPDVETRVRDAATIVELDDVLQRTQTAVVHIR